MKKLILLSTIVFLVVGCESIFSSKEAKCVIVGDITLAQDSSGNAKFLGEIENEGDKKAYNVKIRFTIKNSSNDIIGEASTLVNTGNIEGGATSSFECFTDVPRSSVSSWLYEITWDDSD
jgi:hypothetical protein